MKRLCALAIAVTMIFTFAPPALAGIGVRVTTGMSHIGYDDFNDFIKYANEQFALRGFAERFDDITWIPELHGEIFYDIPFLRGASAGVGFGILFGKAESSVGIEDIVINYIEHRIKAYPITLTAYYQPDLSVFARPFFFAGVGFYHSDISIAYPVEIDLLYWTKEADLDTWSTGFHGGAGIEMSLMPHLSFELAVKGRWAKLDGFEGTASYPDKPDEGSEDVFLGILRTGEGVEAFGAEPLANRGSTDEAAVDLSGYAITISLKLSF